MIAVIAVLLFVAAADESHLSRSGAANTDREGRGGRAPIRGDYNYNGGNVLRPRHLSGPESDEETNIDREELKERYLREAGRELTDVEIDTAVEEARRRAHPKRFGPGREPRLTNETDGTLISRSLEERRRKLVVSKNRDYVLVSGASPGWYENPGRNEFYCASVKKIERRTLRPKRGQKLTLSDCYDTPEPNIHFEYKASLELVAVKIDGFAHIWCLGVKNVNSDSKIQIDHCDTMDDKQLWDLYENDNTWQPNILVTSPQKKCVTAHPIKSASRGGGKLKLKDCSVDPPVRSAQVFYACESVTNCDFDEALGFLECILEERCTNHLN